LLVTQKKLIFAYLKTDSYHGTARHTMDTAFFQLPQGFSQIKPMKDYAEYQGYTDIRSSRDAIRKALEMGLIDDKQWTETIEARNLTSHNHDNDVVSEEKMQSLNTPSLFD